MVTKRKPSKKRQQQKAIHASKNKKRKEVTGLKKTTTKKSTGRKKPAFGGYAIDFKGRNETAEDIFGKKPIAPSLMTKKIWAFVKAKQLGNK
jgi:hypothetical protein